MAVIKLLISLCLVAAVSCSVISSSVEFLRDISKSEGRIVGGHFAGNLGFQASLQENDGTHFCSASVVSNRWLISAAQCTYQRYPSWFLVRLGSNSRDTGGVSYTVSQIRNHPDFNAYTLANDISTIQTSTVIVFGDNVRAISIGCWHVGTGNAQVSGWGQTSHPGSFAANLQALNTRTLTNADCHARHYGDYADRIVDNTICTFTQSSHGICMGDAGGPLTTSFSLVGVISWGIPCALGYPDVYTRISSHCNWIVANT